MEADELELLHPVVAVPAPALLLNRSCSAPENAGARQTQDGSWLEKINGRSLRVEVDWYKRKIGWAATCVLPAPGHHA